MKLRYQLFVVLLLASALLIALMLAVNSVSFDRQFINYVNSVEHKRLEPLVAALAEGHSETNDWQWINKRVWRELIRQHAVEHRNGSLRNRVPRNGRPPPPPDRKPGNRRPPPGKAWLTLVDADRTTIVGTNAKSERMEWIPITSETGPAGYLGFVRHRQFNRQIDREFARQQRRNFIYSAVAMVILSGLLAVPLATRIIRPLSEVNHAIAALSDGDYQYRTSSSRRDEFGDLARNINRLGDSLEQNKEARQRWIAEISHELRTPVAVLQGEIEAIQDGIRSADGSTVQSLHAEVLRLSRLIDDLHQLSVSDIGALDYRMEKLPLHELLENFLSMNRSIMNAKIDTVNVRNDSATVLGDAERLSQLLDNLLQNTLRYTTSPATLEIELIQTASLVQLRWADSSPGVSDDDLPHLFEPLYRADKSRSRKTSGSGLGLAIVQKIVAAHSGTIKASHAKLGGLELLIEFPATA